MLCFRDTGFPPTITSVVLLLYTAEAQRLALFLGHAVGPREGIRWPDSKPLHNWSSKLAVLQKHLGALPEKMGVGTAHAWERETELVSQNLYWDEVSTLAFIRIFKTSWDESNVKPGLRTTA